MITNSSLDSLAKMNPRNAKSPSDMYYYSNLYNKSTIEMRFPGTGKFKYLNMAEEQRSKKEYKEFEYLINDIGFRNSYPLMTDENIMGFFGCSMTFGEGLPTEDTFPHIVSQHFNKSCLNLGMPGASSKRIAKIFDAATEIWKIETAIVTLPNWARFHYVGSNGLISSIALPHYHGIPESEKVRNAMVKRFSDQHMFSMMQDDINHILLIAKQKNINLIFGSWTDETQQLIKHATNYPPAQYVYDVRVETARDNCHPGPIAARKYANRLIEIIGSNNYVY